jgi:hypothetical protein
VERKTRSKKIPEISERQHVLSPRGQLEGIVLRLMRIEEDCKTLGITMIWGVSIYDQLEQSEPRTFGSVGPPSSIRGLSDMLQDYTCDFCGPEDYQEGDTIDLPEEQS